MSSQGRIPCSEETPKTHSHQRRIVLHPELSGRIALHFNDNSFAQFKRMLKHGPCEWEGKQKAEMVFRLRDSRFEFLRALGSQLGVSVWQHTLVG